MKIGKAQGHQFDGNLVSRLARPAVHKDATVAASGTIDKVVEGVGVAPGIVLLAKLDGI